MLCTDDADGDERVLHGAAEKIGHSARRLRVPTLGDRLERVDSDARVVTLSMKPRSAIMLAGKGGTGHVVRRCHQRLGHVHRVTRHARSRVQDFLDANPMDRDRAGSLDPLAPSAFTGLDDAPRRAPEAGMERALSRIRLPALPGRRRASSTSCGSAAPSPMPYLADHGRRTGRAYAARAARRRGSARRQLFRPRLRGPRLRTRQR